MTEKRLGRMESFEWVAGVRALHAAWLVATEAERAWYAAAQRSAKSDRDRVATLFQFRAATGKARARFKASVADLRRKEIPVTLVGSAIVAPPDGAA